MGGEVAELEDADLTPLISEHELALAARLADFPATIEAAARDRAPHQLAFWLKELAAEFHAWYNAERLLIEDEAQKRARLALAVAVRQVIRNGLSILGVSAPDAM
ncbi:MAG: DALR anticodon-binding domain-containing protein [Rhodocyclaceae bacterium]